MKQQMNQHSLLALLCGLTYVRANFWTQPVLVLQSSSPTTFGFVWTCFSFFFLPQRRNGVRSRSYVSFFINQNKHTGHSQPPIIVLVSILTPFSLSPLSLSLLVSLFPLSLPFLFLSLSLSPYILYSSITRVVLSKRNSLET